MPWLLETAALFAYLEFSNATDLWPLIIGLAAGLVTAAYQLFRRTRRKT